ncbi:hypothetical protein [Nocardia africana]|uniref:hypothetical protein n=1 Tax=Nocardia africana TaxID=134964 RepID=UPI0007A4809D|nr:hypothetical protein [Nocardia africana]MCC3313329.1 hypothetical protein [Nocardia africana]
MWSMNLSATTAAARRGSPDAWSGPLRQLVGEFADIEIVDRSMTLAAKIFTCVLPVIIAGSVFSQLDLATRAIDDQLGLDRATFRSAFGVVAASDPTFAAFGVVGLLMVVISGASFAKTLARIYGKLWDVPAIGLRDAWRWPVVLLVVAFSAATIGAVRELAGLRYVGLPLTVGGEFLVWMFVWTLCGYLLTLGTLRGRALWTTGVLTAVGLTAVRAVGRLVLPKITASAQVKFGLLGPVFTAISWLFVLSLVVVGAATITKVLVPGPTRTEVRGGEPDAGG